MKTNGHDLFPSQVVGRFLLKGGVYFEVTKEMAAELERFFPDVDIEATLRREIEPYCWGLEEQERYTKRGAKRFLVRWLRSEQEKAA